MRIFRGYNRVTKWLRSSSPIFLENRNANCKAKIYHFSFNTFLSFNFLISVLILLCVTLKFVPSFGNVSARHETHVLNNNPDAPTFHNLILSISLKRLVLFKMPVKVISPYTKKFKP